MLKIQDDEKDTGKDRDWSGLKADVLSIEWEEGNDQNIPRMSQIGEFIVFVVFNLFISYLTIDHCI